MSNKVKDFYDDEYDDEEGIDLTELEDSPTCITQDINEFVKDTYKKINFAYGIYKPKAVNIFHPFLCCLYFSIIVTFAFSFVVLHLNGVYPWGVSLWWLFVSCIIWYIVYSKKYELYFYKCKGRTITIYNRNGNITIYFNKKQVFQYKNYQWTKITDWDDSVDNKLLFSRIKGNLKIENKKEKVEIVREDRYGGIEFINDNLAGIWYCPVVKVGMVKNTHSSNYTEIKILEINTNRYAEIPKSFIDFCKEQGIEPPEECEHLHYV